MAAMRAQNGVGAIRTPSAKGKFKNRRKSRSRRGYEAELVFAAKSASLRRRLPFLNSPWPSAAGGQAALS